MSHQASLITGEGANDRERLMGMLRGHVANGETVRKEDIETFFAGLRRGGES